MADKNRTREPGWEDVRYFLALSRSGTLSGAARSLRVNHATVARRLVALETALGTALFERRTDGYSLTPGGEAALQTALTMEKAALALPESADSAACRGMVRLTTVTSLANHVLAGGLGGFARDCPGVVIELLTDIRILSLARREADIALRLGHPKDSSLTCRRLANVHYAFYAAKGRPAGCASVPFIANATEAAGIAEAQWLEKRLTARAVAFRSNSIEAQAAAARAGLGIALLPRYMGDRDRALAEVHPMEPFPPRELWLFSPKELARTPRVRLAMDAVARIIALNLDLIEGKTVARPAHGKA